MLVSFGVLRLTPMPPALFRLERRLPHVLPVLWCVCQDLSSNGLLDRV